MNTLIVKNINFSTGLPKICVPMVGASLSELTDEIAILKQLDFEVIEWRADFFVDVGDIEKVKQVLVSIGEQLPEKVLLFTFRTAQEGGEQAISLSDYQRLNQVVVETGLVDFIDVELFTGDEVVKQLIVYAHQHDVAVVVSNHDFAKTPPRAELLARLQKMQALGGDLPKIAVMPQCAKDVMVLLEATRIMHEHHADRPFITMSMGRLGVISRLAGSLTGSAMTFGSAKKASAPGQIDAVLLRNILPLLG